MARDMLSTETLSKSQTRGKRSPYIPIPANFLNSPRVQVLTVKHGAGALGTLLQVIGFLRAEPGYTISTKEIADWADANDREISDLIDLGFLAIDGERIYSPDLIAWMQPLEDILEAKRRAGSLGGKQKQANESTQKQTLADASTARGLLHSGVAPFISSPLIRSDLVKEGGAGGDFSPQSANPQIASTEAIHTPHHANALPAHSTQITQPIPSGQQVEILPPEAEYGFPGCYLTSIEHDQIRVHTPDHLIRRAAQIVRGHWIKNPQKPVKKFSAELQWALVEARKQAAENDLARSKAQRARDGPTPRTNEPIPIGKRRPKNAVD